MNKKCNRCFIMKPYNLEFFPKEINKKSGLASHCRECHRKHSRKRIGSLTYSTPETKVCNHCKTEKPCNAEHFHRHNKNKTGFRSICKVCRTSKSKVYSTSDEYRAKQRARRRADPLWKLRKNISIAIVNSLRQNKEVSCFKKLPYSIKDLKEHLESQFEPWMTWENWGTAKDYSKNNRTWNIDHIVPQSKLKFNSLDDENFLKCWSLRNLRPLDAIENIRKSNKQIGDEHENK